MERQGDWKGRKGRNGKKKKAIEWNEKERNRNEIKRHENWKERKGWKQEECYEKGRNKLRNGMEKNE